MSKDAAILMEMQVFVFGDLTAAFKPVGILPEPLNFIRIVNTMDAPVIISFDGQYGNDYVQAGSSIDVNNQACHPTSNGRSLFKKGTTVYVKRGGGIPKGGSLIVSGFYLNYI